MSIFLLQTLSWTIAHTPEWILRGITWPLGGLAYLFRRRTLLSNLSHAFPERDPAHLRRIARECSRRLVETGLLSLAISSISEERYQGIISASEVMHEYIRKQQKEPSPALLAAVHMAYWEAQTSMQLVLPKPFPEMGTIFRPIDNPDVNAWILNYRERFGMRMLSRKDGFQEALRIMRRRGIIGILFDQNAGNQGTLATLFGRVCSTSELPGLLVQKFSANLLTCYAVRRAFWRVEITVDEVPNDGSTNGVTLALNRWLEQKITTSENFCASWLWAHQRWKNQDTPGKRLRLEAKRNILTEDLAARKLDQIPRRTRLWIRTPNWLGDVVMMLPLLRAIRTSRPDAEITLVAKPAYHAFLHDQDLADHLVALPAKGWGYFAYFWRLRTKYPDCYLLFTNSVRADIEAWLTRSPQRFGLVRSGKRRPLLSHSFEVPEDFNEKEHHQLELWTQFLQHFGLSTEPDCTPLTSPHKNAKLVIGMIAGSENEPEKRWPIAHWCTLISLLPDSAHLVLFGTANDRVITDEITARCNRPVENLAGRTTMPEYCQQLKNCSVLVTNDTGGMHLANALGVSTVALFGPTNPVRTRPVFTAPVAILQPVSCLPTGGSNLEELTPVQVLNAFEEMCPVCNGLD